MATDKKSALIYTDWITIFEGLTDEEAGQLIKHLMRYINDLNPEPPNRLIKLIFEPIKLHLKRDLVKYEQIREKRSLAGLASAESRKQNQQVSTHVESVEQTSTNSTVNDNVNVNVKENVLHKEKDIYIESGHLSITWGEMNTLIDKYGAELSDDMVKRILNYRKNTKYKSLYLTADKWIKKEIADNKAKEVEKAIHKKTPLAQ